VLRRLDQTDTDALIAAIRVQIAVLARPRREDGSRKAKGWRWSVMSAERAATLM
jgi:hypothetical protein